MHNCSIAKKLEVVRGGAEDYKRLARFHYRESELGVFAAIFALKPKRAFSSCFGAETVGVIVYTMPSPGLELRNVATSGFFAGFDKATWLALVNQNIRCASRVIIEPRFRGLGLASRLVSETMPQMDVPIVEAMAVMGAVNPFFEKAGMTAYTAKVPARNVQLLEAFCMVGVEKEELLDGQKLYQKLQHLRGKQGRFIEHQIQEFLKSFGKRRNKQAGLDRTRFVLSRLTARPVYYIWFNPKMTDGN